MKVLAIDVGGRRVFWIARPQVRLGALSGLKTIVSGKNITVAPGNGERTNQIFGPETARIKGSM
jgi:paraquat-inducible protein B